MSTIIWDISHTIYPKFIYNLTITSKKAVVMKIKEAVAQRIINLCKERNIAVNALGNLSGINPSTIYSSRSRLNCQRKTDKLFCGLFFDPCYCMPWFFLLCEFLRMVNRRHHRRFLQNHCYLRLHSLEQAVRMRG